MSGALCEAAKNGEVNELRELLANCSPSEVNASQPKHGYRALHYGVHSPCSSYVMCTCIHHAVNSMCKMHYQSMSLGEIVDALDSILLISRLERHDSVGKPPG
jgi:hypothetical protein